MLSDVQFVRVREAGSKAPLFMNALETMGASCLIGDTIWDWRGNGLFIGGVGGALGREKTSLNGTDWVVGVPLYDEDEEVWP